MLITHFIVNFISHSHETHTIETFRSGARGKYQTAQKHAHKYPIRKRDTFTYKNIRDLVDRTKAENAMKKNDTTDQNRKEYTFCVRVCLCIFFYKMNEECNAYKNFVRYFFFCSFVFFVIRCMEKE